jgi:hypothetical protein
VVRWLSGARSLTQPAEHSTDKRRDLPRRDSVSSQHDASESQPSFRKPQSRNPFGNPRTDETGKDQDPRQRRRRNSVIIHRAVDGLGEVELLKRRTSREPDGEAMIRRRVKENNRRVLYTCLSLVLVRAPKNQRTAGQ